MQLRAESAGAVLARQGPQQTISARRTAPLARADSPRLFAQSGARQQSDAKPVAGAEHSQTRAAGAESRPVLRGGRSSLQGALADRLSNAAGDVGPRDASRSVDSQQRQHARIQALRAEVEGLQSLEDFPRAPPSNKFSSECGLLPVSTKVEDISPVVQALYEQLTFIRSAVEAATRPENLFQAMAGSQEMQAFAQKVQQAVTRSEQLSLAQAATSARLEDISRRCEALSRELEAEREARCADSSELRQRVRVVDGFGADGAMERAARQCDGLVFTPSFPSLGAAASDGASDIPIAPSSDGPSDKISCINDVVDTSWVFNDSTRALHELVQAASSETVRLSTKICREYEERSQEVGELRSALQRFEKRLVSIGAMVGNEVADSDGGSRSAPAEDLGSREQPVSRNCQLEVKTSSATTSAMRISASESAVQPVRSRLSACPVGGLIPKQARSSSAHSTRSEGGRGALMSNRPPQVSPTRSVSRPATPRAVAAADPVRQNLERRLNAETLTLQTSGIRPDAKASATASVQRRSASREAPRAVAHKTRTC